MYVGWTKHNLGWLVVQNKGHVSRMSYIVNIIYVARRNVHALQRLWSCQPFNDPKSWGETTDSQHLLAFRQKNNLRNMLLIQVSSRWVRAKLGAYNTSTTRWRNQPCEGNKPRKSMFKLYYSTVTVFVERTWQIHIQNKWCGFQADLRTSKYALCASHSLCLLNI